MKEVLSFADFVPYLAFLDYKKTMLMFYGENNIVVFKRIHIEF